VPAGATYAFTIGWATGQTDVDVLDAPRIAGTGVGPNAGCLSPVGGDKPWAQPEVGLGDFSAYNTIRSSISSARRMA
jgi:hypothetical protein